MDEAGAAEKADVFISYASEDRDAAERLAEALESRTWSVWWDRDIAPGSNFNRAIEEALLGARCVIVLWSPASVGSDWVQAEASDARSRDTLVPAIIEECVLPLEFRRIEAAQIGRSWQPDDFEFQSLLQAVAVKLDHPRVVEPPTVARRRWFERTSGRTIAISSTIALLVIALVVWLNRPNETTTTTTSTASALGTTTTVPAARSTTVVSTTASSTPADSATEPRDPVDLLAEDPVTELGIGSIRGGMRADEIRNALPEGLVIEQYDQQGPLVDTEGVTVRGPTGEVVMYALASPGEGPGLDVLIFVDEAFRTSENVGPGSTIASATLAYGGATLSYNTSSESREFVDFQYDPYTDIWFRVASTSGEFGGIYSQPLSEFNTTTEYRDGARIESLWVLRRQT